MYADLYRAMAERGFGPDQVDRWDWYQVRSILGQHRHPDYWEAWADARREKAAAELDEERRRRRPSRRGGGVPSRGARLSSDRIARSKRLFDARRAAARGEGPEPEPAAPSGAGIELVARLLRRGG